METIKEPETQISHYCFRLVLEDQSFPCCLCLRLSEKEKPKHTERGKEESPSTGQKHLKMRLKTRQNLAPKYGLGILECNYYKSNRGHTGKSLHPAELSLQLK